MSIVSSFFTRIEKISFFIYKTPILQVSLAIILGAVFGSTISCFFSFVLIIIIVLGKRIPFLKFSKFLLGFLLGLLLISIRLFLVRDELPSNHVSNFNGNNISIIGVVTSDSRMKSDTFSAVIKTKDVCSDDISLLSEGIRTHSDSLAQGTVNSIRTHSDILAQGTVNSIQTHPDSLAQGTVAQIRTHLDIRTKRHSNPTKISDNLQKDSDTIRAYPDILVKGVLNEIRTYTDIPAQDFLTLIRTYSNIPIEVSLNPIRTYSDIPAQTFLTQIRTYSDIPSQSTLTPIRTYSDIRTKRHSNPTKISDNLQKDSDIIRTHSDTEVEAKLINNLSNEISAVENNSKKINGTRSVVTKNSQSNFDKNLNISEQSEDSSESCVSAQGKVQTWLPRYPKPLVGDVIQIKGDLNEPEDFENTDKFSYKNYLKSKGIHSLMYRPEVEYSKQRQIFFLYDWLVKFRELLFSKINTSLPEPHASLLCGILFGAQRNMPDDFADSLRVTGTTHVIAASGYNVTLVINGIIGFLSFMHRRRRIVLAVIFVWIFVIFSGASLPVVRAGIMGTFTLAAMLTGNESDVHVALPLSAAIMVVFDPTVIKSISFQLSFVSTVGLVYFVPVLEFFFPWIPDSLKESTLVTLAAIIATFPITAFNFGEFSIVAFLANFLVLPVIELVMMFGVILVLLPRFLGFVFTLCASVVWVPLDYFVKVVNLLGSLKFASVSIGDFPPWAVFTWYFLIFLMVIQFYPDTTSNYLVKDLRL